MKKVVVIIIKILCCLIFLALVGYNIITYIELNKAKKNIDYDYTEKKQELNSNINNIKEEINQNIVIEIENDDVITSINNYIVDLENPIEELNIKETNLTEQKNTLSQKYNSIIEEEERKERERRAEEIRKNTFMLSNVPTINQYSQGYPTGCESAALTLLLKYWGVNVSMSEIVNILPKGSSPYYEGSVLYGGNPYLEFIGDPSQYGGYGVYNNPISDVANNFKSGVINSVGKSLDEILSIVSEGRPVIVWNSMYLALPYISTSWIYKPTGETINWIANEHAILVIGYNSDSVITSDTLTGTIKYYSRSTFESRYNYYGKRAVYY